MPALTATTLVDRQPLGEYFLKVVSVATSLAAQDDEWVAKADLGFESVVAAVATPNQATVANPNILLNAQGTGGTEGANPGDIGVETQTNAGTLIVFAVGR